MIFYFCNINIKRIYIWKIACNDFCIYQLMVDVNEYFLNLLIEHTMVLKCNSRIKMKIGIYNYK